MKAIGCLLLLGVTLYTAWSLALLRRRRLRLREGILCLLHHLSANLSCFSLPLSALYASFQNEALEACGFLSLLREAGLLAALEGTKDALSLSSEEREVLYPFAEKLGKGYLGEEQALCRYAREGFERLYNSQREEFPKKRKTEGALVVTGGLMVILLFL